MVGQPPIRRPAMRKPNREVTPDDVTARSSDGTCFYCSATLGREHNKGCVVHTRTVIVEVTLRFLREVPDDWSEDQIEQHRNLSGHTDGDDCAVCAFNTLNTLSGPMFLRDLRFVREATAEDEKKFVEGEG